MEKVQAIVIHHTPYKDNSCIAQFYTAEHGRLHAVVHGMKGKGSRLALLQPMFVLDLVVQASKSSDLYAWKEGQLAQPLFHLPFDVRKRAICMFMGEFLYKCVREQAPNEALFAFLKHAVVLLDMMEEGVENFHLYVMAQCIKFLGFAPMFAEDAPSGIRFFSSISSAELPAIRLSRIQRQEMIQEMLNYLSLHSGLSIQFRSLSVLEELFA